MGSGTPGGQCQWSPWGLHVASVTELDWVGSCETVTVGEGSQCPTMMGSWSASIALAAQKGGSVIFGDLQWSPCGLQIDPEGEGGSVGVVVTTQLLVGTNSVRML